jgi:hypothetical protein
MASYLGGTPISQIYLGSTPIQSIYVGSTAVFASGPTISSVSPNTCVVGDTVTITGAGFSAGGAVSVTVGGVAVTATVASDTSLTFVSALTNRGAQDVVVTVGGVSVTAAAALRVMLQPTITGVSPTEGGAGVGILINGTNFVGETTPIVAVGGVPAGSVSVLSANAIIAAIPTLSTTGSKDVEVATNDGRVTLTSALTYYRLPTYSSISPASATAGSTVTITGTNFAELIGQRTLTSVTIGGVNAQNVSVSSPTSLTCQVPNLSSAGAVNVAIATPAGEVTGTGVFSYTFAAPTYSSISPTSGRVSSTVTITGTNFTGATAVTIGGTAATFTVSSATTISATVPAGLSTGSQSVVVTTPGGTVTGTNVFTVNPPNPTYASISPASGVPGTSVTITGANFLGATMTIGGSTPSFTVNSSTSITFVVPASLSNGAKSIYISTSGGAVSATNVFTVNRPAPTFTSVNIPQGVAGLVVTVTGTNFVVGATTATVGGVTATCSATSTTSANVTIPTGTAGAKSIALSTTGGTATGVNVFTQYAATAAAQTSYTTPGGYTYTIPAWCNKIDVVLIGGGAGGGGGGAGFNNGTGGGKGTWNGVTLTRGSSITWGTTTLNATVGAAGLSALALTRAQTAGGASTCPTASLTGAGGAVNAVPAVAGQVGSAGQTVASYTFNGRTYGGAAGGTAGRGSPYIAAGSGGAPGAGGGGGGGVAIGATDGGQGGQGAVYFYAYQ